MQGEYRCILQLVGVLSNGKIAKSLTDRVIDRMETIQNLRKAISLIKLRADSAEPNSPKQQQLQVAFHNYLGRYVRDFSNTRDTLLLLRATCSTSSTHAARTCTTTTTARRAVRAHRATTTRSRPQMQTSPCHGSATVETARIPPSANGSKSAARSAPFSSARSSNSYTRFFGFWGDCCQRSDATL